MAGRQAPHIGSDRWLVTCVVGGPARQGIDFRRSQAIPRGGTACGATPAMHHSDSFSHGPPVMNSTEAVYMAYERDTRVVLSKTTTGTSSQGPFEYTLD